MEIAIQKDQWYDQISGGVTENEESNISWNAKIQCDHEVKQWEPYIDMGNRTEKNIPDNRHCIFWWQQDRRERKREKK